MQIPSNPNAAVSLQGSARLALFLPLFGYAIFASEALVDRPNLIWASVLLGWAIGATVLAWWLMGGGASHFLDSIDRHASQIAVGVLLTAVTVLILVSVLQDRYFALSVHAEDTAYYSQLLWNTLHGDFLSGNVQQARLYHPPVSNDLALHVSPVLLGLLPIYALFPHALTLIVVRDILLVAAAWPLFLLARERMGGTAGVAAVFLYLLNPVVIAQGVEAFYLLQLAPVIFFYALRAFTRENFSQFASWTGLALSLREDVAIAVAGFGILAFVEKRQWRWVVTGIGIPIIWWGVATLLIQPAFGRWGNSTFDVSLAGGQSTPLGIYQSLLGSPVWIVDALRSGGMNYLYRSLRAVAFLGVLGWEGLLAAPSLAANLFLGRAFYSGNDPISRFALLPACALIGATVLVVGRIGSKYRWDSRVFAVLMFILLPSVSLLDGVKDSIQARLESYTVENDATALWEAMARIPPTASVAAPNYALPALSKRKTLFYMEYLDMYPSPQPDYVLLDRAPNRMPINPELRERYLQLLHTLTESADYETIWQNGQYLLLVRRGITA